MQDSSFISLQVSVSRWLRGGIGKKSKETSLLIGELQMEQVYRRERPSLAGWVISKDAQLSDLIETGLRSSEGLSFEGAFTRWQSAFELMKDRPLKSTSLDLPTNIIIVNNDRKGLGRLQWLSILRDTLPLVRFIILFDEPDEEQLATALKMGVSGFLMKPVSASQIVLAIKTALSGGIMVSPTILEKILPVSDKQMQLEKDLGLTSREKDVLALLVDGYSVKEIADKLYLSFQTAQTHMKNIRKKFGGKSSRAIVSITLRQHVLD